MFHQFVLITVSLSALNASEFITVSTTLSPPPSNRKIRQEHDTFFDKKDQTCEALTKNTYLLEIIKLQNAQIDTTLAKQATLQNDAINSSFAQLQQTNVYIMSEMTRQLQETKEQVVGNILALMANRLGNMCNVNQMRFIMGDVQRIVQQRLDVHEAKLEETKQAIAAQIEDIEKKLGKNEEWYHSLESKLEGTKNEVVEKIQEVAEAQLQLRTRRTDDYNHKLEALQIEVLEAQELLKKVKNLPRNCREIQSRGSNVSGVYYVEPDFAPEPFKVYCDMKTMGGGWIYLMNRFDGTQSFFLNWTDYKMGFGDLNGEFWLGLEHLHDLTGENPSELLVELMDWDNQKAHAFYSTFSIGSEKESYPLKLVGGYSGNATDVLSYHMGMNFSTVDHNNSKGGYCANYFKGAWWYKDCFTTHLTGAYLKGNASTNAKQKGIHWNGFRHLDYSYSLKQARMMIRPQSSSNVLLPHERS